MSVQVIGAGGHAKVVIATLQAAGFSVSAVFDEDAGKHGQEILGAPVVGPIEAVQASEGPLLLALGSNALRQRLAERFPDAEWATAVHPQAIVHSSVSIAPGTVVFAGAVIQPDAKVGAHVIVNTGATIDHDCEIGDYVHMAPGVHLAGHVRMEEGSFLGIGGSAIPGVSIGAWTTVGAGGVVVRDLPARCVATGIPARVMRQA